MYYSITFKEIGVGSRWNIFLIYLIFYNIIHLYVRSFPLETDWYTSINASRLNEASPELNKRLFPTNNIYWKCFPLIILFWNRRFGGSSLLQGSKGSMKEAYSKYSSFLSPLSVLVGIEIIFLNFPSSKGQSVMKTSVSK